MGLLVEDLLLLARLDQQRPLTFAPVDLAGDRRRRRPRREGGPARPADRPAPGRVADRRPRRPGGRRTAAPGRRQPGHQRADPHPGRDAGHRDRGRGARRPGRARAAGRRRGPGHGPGGRRAGVRALLPRRRLPEPRAPAAPAWAWRSCPRSWPPTAARWAWTPRRGRAPSSPSGCPARARRTCPRRRAGRGRPGAGLSRPVTIRT